MKKHILSGEVNTVSLSISISLKNGNYLEETLQHRYHQSVPFLQAVYHLSETCNKPNHWNMQWLVHSCLLQKYFIIKYIYIYTFKVVFNQTLQWTLGRQTCSWLRHCTTRQVKGLILGGVTGTFDIILLAALWPWGCLSLQQKWVPVLKLSRTVPNCVYCNTLSYRNSIFNSMKKHAAVSLHYVHQQ
jgi:hypothetical protein